MIHNQLAHGDFHSSLIPRHVPARARLGSFKKGIYFPLLPWRIYVNLIFLSDEFFFHF
jgi:hypothetical protein